MHACKVILAGVDVSDKVPACKVGLDSFIVCILTSSTVNMTSYTDSNAWASVAVRGAQAADGNSGNSPGPISMILSLISDIAEAAVEVKLDSYKSSSVNYAPDFVFKVKEFSSQNLSCPIYRICSLGYADHF